MEGTLYTFTYWESLAPKIKENKKEEISNKDMKLMAGKQADHPKLGQLVLHTGGRVT